MPALALAIRVLAACAVVTLCGSSSTSADKSETRSQSSSSTSGDTCNEPCLNLGFESTSTALPQSGNPLSSPQRSPAYQRIDDTNSPAVNVADIANGTVHVVTEPPIMTGTGTRQDMNFCPCEKLGLSTTALDTHDVTENANLASKPSSPIIDYQSVQSDPEGFTEAQTMAIDRAIHAAVIREMASRSTLMPLNILLHTFRRVVGITLTLEPLNYDAISLANCIQTVVLVNRFLRTSLLSEPVADGIRLYFLIFWLFGMRAILLYLAYISFGVWQSIDGFFASRTFAILVYTHLLPVPLFISDAIEYIDVARRDRETDNRLTDAEIDEALNQELCAADITDPDLACSMCLHRLQRSHLILCKLRCGHIYHRVCIRAWIKKYNSSGCPVCRANVLPNMESSNDVQEDRR